jgi:glucoamylase
MELGTVVRDAPPDGDLDSWIAMQAQRSITAMELAISATGLARQRDNFGQNIVPTAGSVLASTTIGDWNPEPDYFFHWLRDSAIVMRTVVELMEDAASKTERLRWQTHFEHFVRFSLGITGGTAGYDRHYRQNTNPDFRKFLRSERELRALHGDKLLGEPRFNPDGTIDIMRWSRPQYDGPALRALACLRFLAAGGPDSVALSELLAIDLDFTRRQAGKRCIGPWEEKSARHYYVALVQLGALIHGRRFTGKAAIDTERRLYAQLERHWSEKHGIFVAALPSGPAGANDVLDASFLLGVLDADLPDGPHSVDDPRVHDTQRAIEDMYARELPINRTRFAGRTPALGRYHGDKYFGGGAWFPTTLAAAALCYRRASRGGQDRLALVTRGDGFLATIRDLAPFNGALPEQVDRETGQPTSAHQLTWSHAAFVSTSRLRRLLSI